MNYLVKYIIDNDGDIQFHIKKKCFYYEVNENRVNEFLASFSEVKSTFIEKKALDYRIFNGYGIYNDKNRTFKRIS